MKKTNVKMNKPIYLRFSILYLSKIAMYEFWYVYIKQKYTRKVKLYYMNTDSFIIHIKTKGFYKNIAHYVEKRSDTSNYETTLNRTLPTGKNQQFIGLMKDELGGKIMTEFVALRPKTYSYLIDDYSEAKKAKGTKKCVIERILKFSDYKTCLLDNQIALKSKQRFKSEAHNVYTEEVNKIALSTNDDK